MRRSHHGGSFLSNPMQWLPWAGFAAVSAIFILHTPHGPVAPSRPTDHCSQYVTEFQGHSVHLYPNSIYAPCGGGVHDGATMIITP